MIYALYILALVCVPFTSIKGIASLGELQSVLSAYIYFVLFALCFVPFLSSVAVSRQTAAAREMYGIPVFALLFFAAIGVSFVTNFSVIRESLFFDRSGFEKFATSTLLVGYGFLIAIVTYYISAYHSWDKLIIKPLTVSVVICAVFSFFEIAARLNGAMSSIFSVISAPVYGELEVLQWDTRLRSVSFEPPDFANSACYMWPWILGGFLAAKGTKKLGMFLVWIVLNIMIYMTEARTSLVMMTGLLGVFFALWFVFLPKQEKGDPQKLIMPLTYAFIVLVPAALLFLAYFFDDLVFFVVSGDNISNLSRLASMTAAFRMFMDNPIFGLGFGQFGFHIVEYMPSWGYYSPEIKTWLFGKVQAWPAVYSIYARFGADMGLAGIFMWVGIWLWLARRILIETIFYRQKTQEIPFSAIPLILGCFGVLLAGVPSDSVRSPMIWINMGLACRYLVSMKRFRQELDEKTAQEAMPSP